MIPYPFIIQNYIYSKLYLHLNFFKIVITLTSLKTMSINDISAIITKQEIVVPLMSKFLFIINENVTSNLTLHHSVFKIKKQKKSYKCTSRKYRRWARSQRSILYGKGREARRNIKSKITEEKIVIRNPYFRGSLNTSNNYTIRPNRISNECKSINYSTMYNRYTTIKRGL